MSLAYFMFTSGSTGKPKGVLVPHAGVASLLHFVALAVLPDGTRDVLGLWFQANEGAKFWAKVLSDLRNPIVGETIPRIVS